MRDSKDSNEFEGYGDGKSRPRRTGTGTESLRLNEEELGSEVSVDPMIRDGVTTMVLSAYSVGHFANDLCASMWFIYLSYYLLSVVKLE